MDYIIRGTAAEGQVRFFATTSKELVEKARQLHNTSPVATAALGRLLTAGAMMGSMCKNDSDVITLQIKCSGPIEGLVVTADSKANVKGYVFNPDVMLPPSAKGKLDVGRALDLGVLSVIKDIGLKEHSTKQCHNMLICTVLHTKHTKNMVFVVMVSTAQVIDMCHKEFVNF